VAIVLVGCGRCAVETRRRARSIVQRHPARHRASRTRWAVTRWRST